MPNECSTLVSAQDTNIRNIYPTFRVKHLLLSFVLPLFVQSSFATDIISDNARDPIGTGVKDYKLNREQFLESYGRDDSSRALIDYYFHKRNNAKKLAIAGFILGIVSLVIAGLVISSSPSNGPSNGVVDDSGEVAVVLLLVQTFYGSIALIVTGVAIWIIYSRKKLLKLLEKYFLGKSIPPHIARNHLFNQWLTEEKNRHKHC